MSKDSCAGSLRGEAVHMPRQARGGRSSRRDWDSFWVSWCRRQMSIRKMESVMACNHGGRAHGLATGLVMFASSLHLAWKSGLEVQIACFYEEEERGQGDRGEGPCL